MKKFGIVLLILFSLTLVACTEITDDFNKKQEPSILLSHEGELNQIYDENQTLENVNYQLTLTRFEENNINLDDVEINWFVRNNHITSNDNLKTYTQIVNSPGEITIKVVVKFTLDGNLKQLEEHSVINVFKEATKVQVTNSIDSLSNRVEMKLDKDNHVEFKGVITGNLKIDNLHWIILKQVNNDLIVIDEIAVLEKDKELVGNTLVTKLNYNFTTAGSYVIRLQTGTSESQDANVIISNTTHLKVTVGEFSIKTNKNLIMTENYDQRVLSINGLDSDIVGIGVYKWFLNGEALNNDNNLTYTHNDDNLGGYVYQVKFIPIQKTYLEEIVTDPILILNGKLVNNEEEFITSLEDNVTGIVLNKDINYTGEETIVLNNHIAIYGNDFKIRSGGISEFFKIKGDNVVLANMTIDNSNKYAVHVELANNAYLQDLKVTNFDGQSNILTGDFSAGVYIDRSTAVINNIEFLTGGLVGVRLDQHLVEGKTKLRIYGKFIYDKEQALLMPIASAKSQLDSIELIADGFDYFALPAGEIIIRRWDNIGEPISWEIYNPEKTVYEKGDYLDLFGIGIRIDISFLGIEFSGNDGLAFVKLFINMFSQYGILEITNLEESILLDKFYIVGELEETIYGNDQLFYSRTKEIYKIQDDYLPVAPLLPEESGDYKLKIFIGEEFYLGHIIIKVK